jgi:hypothetical protein
MKKLMVIVSALTLSISSNIEAKAELEVEWEQPEKYTDVRPTNQSKKSFQKSTFKNIESYLGELADGLPDDHKLVIKVTNLDLAGQVWPASYAGLGHGSSDVRVIKDHDIPRIYFNYRLLDASGAVIQQDEVKLKNMTFFDSSTGFFDNDPVRYEKSMLKRWFGKEFESQLSI